MDKKGDHARGIEELYRTHGNGDQLFFIPFWFTMPCFADNYGLVVLSVG